jgi:transcriptional regulator with XRE-family HTH domain
MVRGKPAHPDAEAFGTRVREMREARGMSQEALAKLAEMQQPQLSQIESGKRFARLDTIKKLARAFGVSVHELIND